MGRLLNPMTALLALGLLAGVPAAPTPARAAATPAFGTGNGPIDISADELEVVDADSRAVWKGNVEAIQGANRMRTPQLTVFFGKGGGPAAAGGLGGGFGSIQRMEADGPVYYVTPQQNARGDHATYEAASHSIVMTGNVVLVQDKNVVQGDRLTIDTTTNHSTLVSTAQTRKRVRGVFYSGQQAAPQAGQPAAAAPAARP